VLVATQQQQQQQQEQQQQPTLGCAMRQSHLPCALVPPRAPAAPVPAAAATASTSAAAAPAGLDQVAAECPELVLSLRVDANSAAAALRCFETAAGDGLRATPEMAAAAVRFGEACEQAFSQQLEALQQQQQPNLTQQPPGDPQPQGSAGNLADSRLLQQSALPGEPASAAAMEAGLQQEGHPGGGHRLQWCILVYLACCSLAKQMIAPCMHQRVFVPGSVHPHIAAALHVLVGIHACT
jgi:hypothetical protein